MQQISHLSHRNLALLTFGWRHLLLTVAALRFDISLSAPAPGQRGHIQRPLGPLQHSDGRHLRPDLQRGGLQRDHDDALETLERRQELETHSQGEGNTPRLCLSSSVSDYSRKPLVSPLGCLSISFFFMHPFVFIVVPDPAGVSVKNRRRERASENERQHLHCQSPDRVSLCREGWERSGDTHSY